MRHEGELKTWNEDKRFGFIQPNLGGKQVFIHINGFNNKNRRPEVGQLITYVLSSDKQGRPCAQSASLPGLQGLPNERLSTAQKNVVDYHQSSLSSVIVATLFLLLVGLAVVDGRVLPWVFALYIVASLLAYIMYALDKSAAENDRWRTSESTLHFLSLVGGWPGALVAQKVLRHKSKKQPFRMVFWLTVLLNCGTLLWLLFPSAVATLQSFIFGAL